MILILLLASACSEEDTKSTEHTSDYIAFGHFYGECIGEQCIEIFKMTGNSLYEDLKDQYPNAYSAYEGDFTLLDDSLFEKVKDLRSEVPAELLARNLVVIGQPDAGDWGGIYFEISSAGQRRFWIIDKLQANLPEYLRPFVTEIEMSIDLIEN